MAKQKHLILVTLITFIFYSATATAFVGVELKGDKTYLPLSLKMRFHSLSEKDQDKSLLIRYIKARETYHKDGYDFNYYNFVKEYSEHDVYTNFVNSVDHPDPDSPIYLGIDERVVRIKSLKTTKIDDLTAKATINFVSEDIDTKEGSRFNTLEKTVELEYTRKIDANARMNSINPYNFKVISYNISNGKK